MVANTSLSPILAIHGSVKSNLLDLDCMLQPVLCFHPSGSCSVLPVFQYCNRGNRTERPAGQSMLVVTLTPELPLVLSRISPITEVKQFGQLPLS